MERTADPEENQDQPPSHSGHLPYEGGQSLAMMMNGDETLLKEDGPMERQFMC